MSQLNFPLVPMILFGIATSLIVAANFVFYTILGEVNGKRGPQEQVSMLFVNARFFEVLRLHGTYYPDSRKPAWVYVTSILGFVMGFIGFVLVA